MEFLESEKIELKEIYTTEIRKTIVAFANTIGGIIYIGVSDNGEIIGVDDPDFVMQQISNTLRDSIKPDTSMFTNIELVKEKGKSLIKITVNQGTKQPYYLSDKGIKPSGVFIRSGTSSAPATDDAIRAMIKNSDGDSFEKNRSIRQDLTFLSLTEEMEKRNLNLTEIQMINLGIMTSDKVYTNMGLLLSDQCMHSIKLAVFQGEDKTIFKDRREFKGSLFKQLSESYQLIDFYNGTQASFQGLIRTDRRDYPEDAVREALLNALVHREYVFSGSILINLYNNRLEIISLGGLVAGISLEAAMLGTSQSRNENLAALFYRLKLIEAYGTGISKIISSYKNTGRKPKFENVEGAFRVTLPNINAEKNEKIERVNEETVDTTYEIYKPIQELLERQKEITRKDVEEQMSVKMTWANKIINEMIEKNLIERIGQGKNTKYRKKHH